MRVAPVSIRAQLLLVLTVFLALPWLGYEYVRELERVLRDAQERTLAGTAQAVATALHDRPRLFANPPDPIASFARERANEQSGNGLTLPPSGSPEIAQIVEGLSRTTARIWVIDRDGVVLARAGSLAQPRGRSARVVERASASSATIGPRSTRCSWGSLTRTSPTTPRHKARRAAATSKARSPASSLPIGGRRPTARR